MSVQQPAVVWVRSSSDDQGEGLEFGLHEKGYLMLQSIAAQWDLNPATLRVGTLVLTPDPSGTHSVFHIAAIRAYSAPKGLGDGLTKQTALAISGKPLVQAAAAAAAAEEARKMASFAHTARFAHIPARTEASFEARVRAATAAATEPHYQSLAQKVAAAAAPSLQQFRQLPPLERGALRPYRQLLVMEQVEAWKRDMFRCASAPHHYKTRITKDKESLKTEVATFVGTLHILPRDGDSSKLEDRHACGLVTLVRPEGLCLTASDCLPKLSEDVRMFVCFPRLTGSASYECRAACSDGLVIHLETVERQDFQVCMAPCDGTAGVYMFDGMQSLNLVKCLEVEGWEDPFEVVVLPTRVVDAKAALGGPVFNHRGEVKGVVVDASSTLRRTASRSTRNVNAVTTRSGRELVTQSVADLEWHRERAEVYKDINESLGHRAEDVVEKFNLWTSALSLGRLVQIGPASFETLSENWYEQHPLPKFVEDVVSMAEKPGFDPDFKPPIPRVPREALSERETADFLAEQAVLWEFADRLDRLESLSTG